MTVERFSFAEAASTVPKLKKTNIPFPNSINNIPIPKISNIDVSNKASTSTSYLSMTTSKKRKQQDINP